MSYLEHIGNQPVWRPIPTKVKQSFSSTIPLSPTDVRDVYTEFKDCILPYTKGNIHPRFFAWVQGTGTPLGVLAEMLAAPLL
jgi:aromatic-L-amino-acid/L-tryptophan decarboxylase